MLSSKIRIVLNRQNAAFMCLQSKANYSVLTPLSVLNNRDLHIAHCRQPIGTIDLAIVSKLTPLVGIASVRYSSEDAAGKNIEDLTQIPDTPPVSLTDAAIEALNAAGEPKIASGGLWWFTDLTLGDPYFLLPAIRLLVRYLSKKSSLNHTQVSAQKKGKVLKKGKALIRQNNKNCQHI